MPPTENLFDIRIPIRDNSSCYRGINHKIQKQQKQQKIIKTNIIGLVNSNSSSNFCFSNSKRNRSWSSRRASSAAAEKFIDFRFLVSRFSSSYHHHHHRCCRNRNRARGRSRSSFSVVVILVRPLLIFWWCWVGGVAWIRYGYGLKSKFHKNVCYFVSSCVFVAFLSFCVCVSVHYFIKTLK